jgi:RNA polymerase sigma-70 factor (ECF subfamily)
MSSPQPPYDDIEALINATHRECGGVAYRIVRNYADAEDAVQSACIKVLEMWPKLNGFPSAGRQRAYLLRAVRNEALQILRRQKRRKEHYDLGESGDPGIPERLAELAREIKALRLALKVIDGMPAARRRVVMLWLNNHEYGEIAAMLDISVSTVRSHISNARKDLRRAMLGDWKGE